MNVWRVENNSDEFDELIAIDDEQWDILLNCDFEGYEIKKTWIPVQVKLEKKNKPCDTPCLGGNFIVANEKALNIIKKVAKGSIEILPLICEDGQYSIINITNIINCLDLEKSEFKMYKGANEIRSVERYSILANKLENATLFKMDKFIVGNMFATDIFKEVIETNKIIGLKFTKVWTSKE